MPFFLKNDATTPCCTRAGLLSRTRQSQPQGVCCGTGLVAAPPHPPLQPPYVQPPHRPPLRRPPAPWAVRRARHDAPRRSGRLHAPEAPRTGPVSALRRYSSWSPPGRWLNGHNGHFLGQPTRPWVGTPRGVTQVRWAYPTDFWRTWTTLETCQSAAALTTSTRSTARTARAARAGSRGP